MKKVNIDCETLEIKPQIYKKSGSAVIVAFDECFNVDKKNLNTFTITRPAYKGNLAQICRYSNVFFKYYDTDKEFITGLLSIKYKIDNKTIFYNLKNFIYDICEYLLSDSIIDKIFKMVEDYYTIDLTPSDDVKGIDLHALQFLNEHGKSLLALSVAYKLTIPIVCHYYAVYKDQLNESVKSKGLKECKIKYYLYDIFLSYFPLFQGESNLFNKLAVTVDLHLTNTQSTDKGMWARAKNNKITPTTYIDELICAIVVDLLPKAIFTKNLIYLIQVAIPYQIKTTVLLGKDKYEYSEISTTSKTDELSGLEKLEANSARVDENDIVICKLNIKKTIKKLLKDHNIDISKDEIKYYKLNLNNIIFDHILSQYFAKYFGGYHDLKSIGRKNYIKLLIIFKKVMSNMGFVYLQNIVTGNKSQKVKRRRVSVKQLTKYMESNKYKKIMKKYNMAMNDYDNQIIDTISLLINTPIEYVDYYNHDMLGEIIETDPDIVAMEYMRFLNMI